MAANGETVSRSVGEWRRELMRFLCSRLTSSHKRVDRLRRGERRAVTRGIPSIGAGGAKDRPALVSCSRSAASDQILASLGGSRSSSQVGGMLSELRHFPSTGIVFSPATGQLDRRLALRRTFPASYATRPPSPASKVVWSRNTLAQPLP